jgi:uncharacterized protein (DUF1684 family)
MKFNKWTLIILIILLAIIYVSVPKNQITGPKINEDSLASVESRKLKDETFRNSDESPIKNKELFKGLAYFDFNPKWIVQFNVQRLTKIEKIKINMTDGSQEEMLKFGHISAMIEGKEVKLELFQHADGNLFLPFTDKTAPKETYGGGRYIDFSLNKLNDKTILVDFNQAYFPYCAYNSTFTCPVPPKGNDIPVRIPAGERNF